MRGWLAIGGAAAVVLLACPAVRPCVDCPSIQGRYELTVEEATNRACASGGTVRAGELVLHQAGSNLTGTLVNVPISGVLYERQQLSAFGTPGDSPDAGVPAGVRSVALTGRFVPGPAAVPDRIVGDLAVGYRNPGPDAGTCEVHAPFRAERRSR